MRDKKDGGFTLVEILIVLAVLGILAAVVAPNLTGFLGRGKDQAYVADQGVLQAAVNSYYTDTLAARGSKYPTVNGTAGAAGANTYINMTHLVSGNYLTGVPLSASGNNPGGSSGSYSWYVFSTGVVTSTPVYVSGVYP
ncbi:MAG: type II secretion system protein [Dehalococcoidia bacterium]|nr:type II secretion system protein [Dehalococcoidia bacterium]